MTIESSGILKKTISEAALKANVSIASVSRALNNKPGLSEKTRKRILDVCKELGYVPNSSARELMGNYQNTIAISLGNQEFYPSRYLGMLWPSLAYEIRQSGRNLLPINFDKIELDKVGAVILLGVNKADERINHCKQMGLPFVSIGMCDGEFWVAPDDFTGTRDATLYLIERELKNIAFVTPTVVGTGYLHRYQGYLSAMGSNQLSIREIRTGSNPLSEIAAYRYFLSLSKDELEQLDGFICQCDETALGVLSALEDRGYNIPGDFKIIGYDGLPGISDRLTTVVQDTNLIAHHVSDMVLKAIQKDIPVGSIVPVTLRLGETT